MKLGLKSSFIRNPVTSMRQCTMQSLSFRQEGEVRMSTIARGISRNIPEGLTKNLIAKVMTKKQPKQRKRINKLTGYQGRQISIYQVKSIELDSKQIKLMVSQQNRLIP